MPLDGTTSFTDLVRGGDGITVNNVLPGYTRTQRLDQILADRSTASGKPQDEIAKAITGNAKPKSAAS